MASKYDALRDHLQTLPPERPVEMAFSEVAALVGGLPPSAHNHRAWWSNQQAGSRPQARAWLDAGRTVEAVSLTAERVTFSVGGRRRLSANEP